MDYEDIPRVFSRAENLRSARELLPSYPSWQRWKRTKFSQHQLRRRVLDGLQKLVRDPAAIASTILLCNSPSRFHLRTLLEPFLPRVMVLSPAEIPPGISVQSLGVVR